MCAERREKARKAHSGAIETSNEILSELMNQARDVTLEIDYSKTDVIFRVEGWEDESVFEVVI